MTVTLARRSLLKAGGAMVIALGAGRAVAQIVPGADVAIGKTNDLNEVDGFFAIHADGSVTLYCGKVDLGTGLRIAIPQMAAEELGVAVERIAMVEGDSVLTPNQGPTAGSTGIMRGGVQIRQAAATAREALIRMGAERLGRPAEELEAANGEGAPEIRRAGCRLRRADRRSPLRPETRHRPEAESARQLHDCRQAAAAPRPAGQGGGHAHLHARFQAAEHAACACDPHALGRRHAGVGR